MTTTARKLVEAVGAAPDEGAKLNRRASDHWSPERVFAIALWLGGAIWTLAGVYWSFSAKLDRLVERDEAHERRIVSLETKNARMTEEGVYPAALEQRLGAIERGLADVKALLRESSR